MDFWGLNLGHDAGLSQIIKNKIYNFEFERHIGIKNVCGGNKEAYSFYKEIISQNKNEIKNIGVCDYFARKCDWLPEKLSSIELTKKNPIKEIQITNLERKILALKEDTKLYGVKHHFAHAASTFFTSNFKEAIIITADGSSKNGESFSVSVGKGNIIEIKEIFNNIIGPRFGVFYTKFSNKIFSNNFSEGKLMGLSSYGKEIKEIKNLLRLMLIPNIFREQVFKEKINLTKNIKLKINNTFYDFLPSIGHHFDIREVNLIDAEKSLFEDVFEEIIIDENSFKFDYDYLSENTRNLAFTVQKVFQEELLNIIDFFSMKYNFKNLCLAGGSFLNIMTNTKIFSKYKRIHIPPFCNDSGISIGCSLAIKHYFFKKHRVTYKKISYGGGILSCSDIPRELLIEKYNKEDFFKIAISKLISGKVIGWINSRYELGPRALGNRSILASPLKDGMKDYINNNIKFRENFRPLAPIIIKEKLNKYFYNGPKENPYMLYNYKVRSKFKKILKEIIHIDNTTRVQTISITYNKPIFELLKKFESQTNFPILFNTSLNIKGKPILNSFSEIKNILLKTELDSVFFVDRYWVIRKR